MPTLYTHTTFAQAKARLASLLGDSQKVFYVDEELGFYLREALRFWGLASHYYRQSGRFNTVAGQVFYDARNIQDFSGAFIQSSTVTDQELINDTLYQLMEPPITNFALGYQGSEMFTLGEISNLLENARDDTLRQSGVIASPVSYPLTPSVQRIDLNDKTIHILGASVAEQGSLGGLPMWPIDYFQAQSTVDTAASQTGRPKAYILNYTPILAVDLYPAPQVGGTFNVNSVQAGNVYNPTAGPTVVSLPDDACWISRYSALADLLAADGLANAEQMAQYCEQRVKQGLDLLQGYQSLLWSEINGRRMTIGSTGQLDAQRPNWRQQSGVPRSLNQISWNLFACFPVPDNVYTIEVEMIAKAPIPLLDGDFIQIGREHLDRLYDYAQHIACFKLQGQEFMDTLPLLEETSDAALEHHAAVAGSAINYALQIRQAQSDRLMRPYRRKEVLEQVQSEKDRR